jgi:hypothetical protein
MQRRAVLMARVAASTGDQLTADDLLRVNANARDHRIDLTHDIHLATTNKQDAMRCAPRHLDEDGVAAAAELYMVDCDLSVLTEYRERMFPGAGEYVHVDCEPGTEGATKEGPAARIAELLNTSGEREVPFSSLAAHCGCSAQSLANALKSATVQDAMNARCWRVEKRGRSKTLVR